MAKSSNEHVLIMPRIPDINDKFYYTKTDPNNIISAKKGALFFRRFHKFFFNPNGNIQSHWIQLPYRTVILPVPDDDKPIFFEEPFEVWEKKSDGKTDELGYLLPKTDWVPFSHSDLFITNPSARVFNWIFPVPINSVDPIGSNNSRSYDENFFYAKISGSWVRTPIHVYTNPSEDSGEMNYWHDNLPFIDLPRHFPAPSGSSSGLTGEQSYDRDFFYIKPSVWKRTPLNYLDTSKMTRF